MLKPIGDRVVIKRIEAEEKTSSGIVLPTSAKEQPSIAEVIAIGSEVEKDEKKKGTIKIGDKVIFSKFSGTEVKLEEEEYIIVKYSELLAIID